MGEKIGFPCLSWFSRNFNYHAVCFPPCPPFFHPVAGVVSEHSPAMATRLVQGGHRRRSWRRRRQPGAPPLRPFRWSPPSPSSRGSHRRRNPSWARESPLRGTAGDSPAPEKTDRSATVAATARRTATWGSRRRSSEKPTGSSSTSRSLPLRRRERRRRPALVPRRRILRRGGGEASPPSTSPRGS